MTKKVICDLQKEDGSFMGDKWGECDVRFSYCAIAALSLLNQLCRIDLELVGGYIQQCRNFDGGYGSVPGAESHSGLVFCCIAGLEICGMIEKVDGKLVCGWLVERQLECGGFNGRPEKLEDVRIVIGFKDELMND